MAAKVRLAVLGAGRIGALHARNIASQVSGAELAWVVDLDERAAREAAGTARWSTNPNDVLADPTVNGVIIASATDTHARLIEQAAQAGKDIFCEKPIDKELAPIDQALAAVRGAGVKLQIGFNRRFDPGFAKARKIIQEGGIGQPQLLRLTSRDPQIAPMGYLAVSGGIFKDMTIHDLDMARWIMGEEVASIFAMGSVLIEPGLRAMDDVDTVVLSLKYGSGAIGTIDNSRRAVYGYDVRLEVLGSEGAVAIGNTTATSVCVSGPAGVTSEGPLYWFVQRFEQAYLEEMRHFVDCLQHDRAPSVTGQDGRMPILMAEAAQASLQSGKPVAIARQTVAEIT